MTLCWVQSFLRMVHRAQGTTYLGLLIIMKEIIKDTDE